MNLKKITIRLKEQEQIALISSSINRDMIYGKKQTIIESEGIELKHGFLTDTGELFLRKEIDYKKIDDEGSLIETPTEENVKEKVESSFIRGLTLEPIEVKEMFEKTFKTYYSLENLIIPEGFYKTDFNFRKGIPSKAILIVKKDGNGFLQIIEERLSTWISKSKHYQFFDEEKSENKEEISFQF